MKDYQKIILLQKSANEVFVAITEHIADWWSNDLTGSANQTGDFFNIAFGQTRKTMEILEIIPDQKVVWKCTKAYIDLGSLENKSEWIGTKMIWQISEKDQKTTLTFLHEGLNPTLQCYDVCEDGWNIFLSSLESYLITGKGKPFLKSESTVV